MTTPAAYEPVALARALEHDINWPALQDNEGMLRLLEGQLPPCPAITPGPGTHQPEPSEPDTWQACAVQRLKQHLLQSVPLEWTVLRVQLDPSKSPAAVNAQGVGTPAGVLLFGGVTQGHTQPMEVEHEASWMKSNDGSGLMPDLSRMHQQVKADSSSQVVLVQCSGGSSSSSSKWRVTPSQEAMPVGLSGHTAVVYDGDIYVFGGQMDARSTNYKDPGAREGCERPCTADIFIHRGSSSGAGRWGIIRAADAGGAGVAPLPRMHHSAAVDELAGVMYVYGGVRIVPGSSRQVSADAQLGLLHAFRCHSCRWERLVTTGDWPRTTTLLACFVHNHHLWAIPDVQVQRGTAPPYQLHRMCLHSHTWQLVPVSGQPPTARTGARTVLLPDEAGGKLLVYGGKARAGPNAGAVLADVHELDLARLRWQRLQPRVVMGEAGSGKAAGASSSGAGELLEGMLPLAGHACGVVDRGAVFYGGYGNAATKHPLTHIQVLCQTVRPIQLAGGRKSASSGHAAALQHCRVKLARLIQAVDTRKVLLQPRGYENKRIPVSPLLMALHSTFFADPLLQEALFCDSEHSENTSGDTAACSNASSTDAAPKPSATVLSERALGGAAPQAIEDTVRWMMGLKGVADMAPGQLVEVLRAADCLIMQPLMAEVRGALLAAQEGKQLGVQVQVQVAQLREALPGQEQDIAERGKQALLDTLCQRNISTLMQHAQQHDLPWLKDACLQLVRSSWAKGDDLWLQLQFACRFKQLDMQGWALRRLAHSKASGRTVVLADRAMEIASANGAEGAMRQFLSNEIFAEVAASSDPGSMLGAVLRAAEQHNLQSLKTRLTVYFSDKERWQAVQKAGQVHSLLLKFPLFARSMQQAAGDSAAYPSAAVGQQRQALAPLRVGGLPAFNA